MTLYRKHEVLAGNLGREHLGMEMAAPRYIYIDQITHSAHIVDVFDKADDEVSLVPDVTVTLLEPVDEPGDRSSHDLAAALVEVVAREGRVGRWVHRDWVDGELFEVAVFASLLAGGPDSDHDPIHESGVGECDE